MLGQTDMQTTPSRETVRALGAVAPEGARLGVCALERRGLRPAGVAAYRETLERLRVAGAAAPPRTGEST